MTIFKSYLEGLINGDYNCWQGTKLGIENVSEGIKSMDEEMLSALVPICKTCKNGPGIYSVDKEIWLKLKESCKEMEGEMEGMSSEDADKYLKENFREMYLESVFERLGSVLKNLCY